MKLITNQLIFPRVISPEHRCIFLSIDVYGKYCPQPKDYAALIYYPYETY